jgi:hypothetical protein
VVAIANAEICKVKKHIELSFMASLSGMEGRNVLIKGDAQVVPILQ